MTELQKKLLELLCEIDEICRKHHIEYALFAGTGLGAERHHGFIPWDDDADIIMTLENYEKFLKVAPKEMRDGRTLNSLETGPDGYFLTYARYVDLNTTAIQRHTAFGGCDPGIKIDIFCAVPTYENLEKANRHRLEILAFAETICAYGVMYSFRDEGFHELFDKEKRLMERMGRQRYVKKRLKQLKERHIRKPKRYVLFSGTMSNSYLIDAAILDEVKYVPFEDKMLPVSKDNISFSKLLYGEGWMHLPPNMEKPRHTMLLDMEQPVEKYLRALDKKMNMPEKRELAARRRKIHLEERERYMDVLLHREKLKNLAIEMSVSNQYQTLNDAEKQDWNRLEQIFQPYYETQLNRYNRFFKIAIPLQPDVFTAAMDTAIIKGNYDHALSVLNIVSKDAGMDSALNEGLRYKGLFCSELETAVFVEKDREKVQTLLAGVSDEVLSRCFTVAYSKSWLSLETADDNMRMESVMEQIDSQIRTFPESGEFLVLKGHCLEKMGREPDALELYKAAADKVKNAIVFQRLLDGGYTSYEEI